MVHGLPVRDQLIEGCQVKVLAKQPQSHQLIRRDLKEKDIINIHLQPGLGCLVFLTGLIPGDQFHRFKKKKDKEKRRK